MDKTDTENIVKIWSTRSLVDIINIFMYNYKVIKISR